jgi:fido (protein-threonine AMPylation protein)
MELVNIHPFEDANGRFARVFMNAELKRGRYLPVVILDDKEYTQAIMEDQKDPGAFTSYLVSIYPTSQKLAAVTEFPDSA